MDFDESGGQLIKYAYMYSSHTQKIETFFQAYLKIEIKRFLTIIFEVEYCLIF